MERFIMKTWLNYYLMMEKIRSRFSAAAGCALSTEIEFG
jgi:hypothetical protein